MFFSFFLIIFIDNFVSKRPKDPQTGRMQYSWLLIIGDVFFSIRQFNLEFPIENLWKSSLWGRSMYAKVELQNAWKSCFSMTSRLPDSRETSQAPRMQYSWALSNYEVVSRFFYAEIDLFVEYTAISSLCTCRHLWACLIMLSKWQKSDQLNPP